MTCLPVIKATSGWVQNGGKYLVYTDQAAVIKAIKEGKTNVDLNAPTTPDNTPGGSTPSGSGTTEGGGSGNTEGGGSNTDQTGGGDQGSESGGDGNMG